MKVFEVKEDCYNDVMAIVKKIVKYAGEIEDALEASEVNHRDRRDYDYDDRMYKGTRYSRF